jgi:hypothetical protein
LSNDVGSGVGDGEGRDSNVVVVTVVLPVLVLDGIEKMWIRASFKSFKLRSSFAFLDIFRTEYPFGNIVVDDDAEAM